MTDAQRRVLQYLAAQRWPAVAHAVGLATLDFRRLSVSTQGAGLAAAGVLGRLRARGWVS